MPDLQITLDYTPGITTPAGVGRYARDLVWALEALHRSHHFTLFSRARPTASPHLPGSESVRLRALPLSEPLAQTLWQQAWLPLPADLLTGRADLWHGLDSTLPALLRSSAIVTIPDLAFLAQPESIEPARAAFLRGAVAKATQRAA